MRVSRWFEIFAACCGLAFVLWAAVPREFQADAAFKGSAFTGWRQIGSAAWKASSGVITGTSSSSAAVGWMLLDQTFQDTQVFAEFRAASGARPGVLLRVRKTADGGSQGILISLADGDLA